MKGNGVILFVKGILLFWIECDEEESCVIIKFGGDGFGYSFFNFLMVIKNFLLFFCLRLSVECVFKIECFFWFWKLFLFVFVVFLSGLFFIVSGLKIKKWNLLMIMMYLSIIR